MTIPEIMERHTRKSLLRGPLRKLQTERDRQQLKLDELSNELGDLHADVKQAQRRGSAFVKPMLGMQPSAHFKLAERDVKQHEYARLKEDIAVRRGRGEKSFSSSRERR